MIRERLAAQLLSGPPARSVEAVAERLLAIQAQDPRGARLAIRARSHGLTAADVDRALDEGRVLVTWLNRGTLHLVRREDYPWLHALTTPQLATGSARRLAQEGVTDPEKPVRAVERALAEEGPLTAKELAARIGHSGSALYHVLFLASRRGLVVRGPMRGRAQAYVLVRDWLGDPRPVDRGAALAELGRRYLAGHGPADDRDLAKWAGINLGDARRALAGARPPRREPQPLPPPRLLGPFEPLLLGWASREDVLEGVADLVTVNGLFRPFALAGGRAVATWRIGGEIEPFAALEPDVAQALADDAVAVDRFLAG